MIKKDSKSGEIIQDGEARVIAELEKQLDPPYRLYANLKLTQNKRTRDYDAIVFAPHAVYVIEVKDYGGTITGDSQSWLVGNKTFTSPLNQVADLAAMLKGMMKAYYLPLGDVWVQYVVALAGQAPDVRSVTDKERLRWVVSTAELPNLIKDRKRIGNRAKDILPLLEYFHRGIKETFYIPTRINEYTINECAWMTSTYRAYVAESASPPYVHILKVYDDLPSDDEKTTQFINNLRREQRALKQIVLKGDPASGGQKHVVMGENAFYSARSRQMVIPLEWVEGHPLNQLLMHPGALSLVERYRIAAQVCRGMAFAHSAKIIHRNLTPSSLVRTKDGTVKLIDFDYAKFTDPKNRVGTVHVESHPFLRKWLEEAESRLRYLAPELLTLTAEDQKLEKQHENYQYHKATIETDLYALGVIFWELFTNQDYTPENRLKLEACAQELDRRVAIMIKCLCDPDPAERANVNLLEAAELFENLGDDSPEDKTLPELKPGQMFEGYEIVEKIAESSMSVTYKAKDRDRFSTAMFVIKLLRGQPEDDCRQEMQRAYRILKQIDPQYTARWQEGAWVYVRNGKIVPSDEPKSHIVYYQILEFIEGQNLSIAINSRQLTAEQALAIGAEALRAVRVLHNAGWIHQDIKPDNFMLTPDNQVKIIDFGVSRRLEDLSISPFSTFGGYLPPEVLKDDGVPNLKAWTMAGDVYSLAGVLAALLCGQIPVPIPSPRFDRDAIEQKAGMEILTLIEQDMNPDPDKRHADAGAMLADFEAILAASMSAEPVADEASIEQAGPVETPMNNTVDVNELIDYLKQASEKAFEREDMDGFMSYTLAAEQLSNWQKDGCLGAPPEGFESWLQQMNNALIGEPEPEPTPSVENPIERAKQLAAQASSLMPKAGIRFPKAALALLEQAVGIEGLTPNMRSSLMSGRQDCQQQLADWQQANDLVEEAQNQNDPAEKQRLLREAQEVYPWHESVFGQQFEEPVSAPDADLQESPQPLLSGADNVSPAQAGLETDPGPIDEEQEVPALPNEPAQSDSQASPLENSSPTGDLSISSPDAPEINVEENQRIEQLLASVAGEIEKQRSSKKPDYDEAEYLLAQIFALRETHPQANRYQDEISRHKHILSIRVLKNYLLTSNDVGPLNAAYNDAIKLISEGHGDASLQEVADQGKQRLNDLRKSQGNKTTDDVLSGLEGINKTLKAIDKGIKEQNLTTWYDARAGQDRPIYEVSSELRSKQVEKALEAANKLRERAAVLMPEDGIRSPKAALVLLDAAIKLEGLEQTPRAGLQALHEDWQNQLKQWELANGQIEKAKAELDNLKKLRLAQSAQQSYKWHADVFDMTKWVQSACTQIANALGRAIKTGEEHLAGEEDEALRQRRSEKIGPLQAFTHARQVVRDVMAQADILKEDEISEALSVALNKADVFLEQVSQVEQRRNNIRALCDEIDIYINKRDIPSAKNIYRELDSALKSDKELAYFGKQFDQLYDLNELLAEAEKSLAAGQWPQCIEICDITEGRISREKSARRGEETSHLEDLLDHIRSIKLQAELHNLQVEIARWWGKQYYDTAAGQMAKFEAILGYDALKAELRQVLDWSGKQFEIDRRRQNDNTNGTAHRYQVVKNDLDECVQALDQYFQQAREQQRSPHPGLPDEHIQNLTEMWDELEQIKHTDSLYSGAIRTLWLEVGRKLYKLVVDELKALYESEPNLSSFDRPFQLAQKLQSRKLGSPDDIVLRLWAVKGYYQNQAQELRGHGAVVRTASGLEQTVRNWEDAFRQFKSLGGIDTALEAARYNLLLHVLDTAIADAQYARVYAILNHAENVAVFDPDIPFDFVSDEDPELKLRSQVARALQKAGELYAAQEYTLIPSQLNSVLTALDQRDELEAGSEALESAAILEYRKKLKKAVERQKQQMVESAVEVLIKRGDDHAVPGSRQNISAAVGAYAQALSLQPDNLQAQARINQHRNVVVSAIEKAYDEAQAARGRIGLENLDGKRHEFQQLKIRIIDLQAACGQLSLGDQQQRQLESAIQSLDPVITDLDFCRRSLDNIHPNGEVWRNKCLVDGHWSTATDIYGHVKDILGINHEECRLLDARITLHRKRRADIQALRSDLENSFLTDAFNETIRLVRKLEESLGENLTLNNLQSNDVYPPPDPYKVIPAPYMVFDTRFGNQVPVFKPSKNYTPPEGAPLAQLPLELLCERRKNNAAEWGMRLRDITRSHSNLVDEDVTENYLAQLHRPRRDSLHPTRLQLNQVAGYIDTCTTTLAQLKLQVEDTPAPISKLATKWREECLQKLTDIEASIEAAPR
jgi:serine/threonine protein kinase